MIVLYEWVDELGRLLQLVYFEEYGHEIHSKQVDGEWDVVYNSREGV